LHINFIEMTIVHFNNLNEEQKNVLIQAPAFVSYLIGGADNNFDEKEMEIAKYTVNLRKTVGEPLLFDYYMWVAESFNIELDTLVSKYEHLQADARTKILVEEIEKLNEVLALVDGLYAKALLKSWKSLAREVAGASGGFLGMLNVSYEEEHLLDLAMINIED
jgi:hypothetical protein